MNVRPAMLEKQMEPTQPGEPERSPEPPDPGFTRPRGSRFTYASGTKPLEGYTIKRGIGIGGFGEVYFALSDAGKEVALKRIQRNLDIELRGVRQCLNLKHVNLIKLWDIRTNDRGESWVVMEYVPGDSLRDVIERYPQGLPQDQLLEWFNSIAAGVTYLHGRGIVHRDLKPGNIFHDEDEKVVKIGDYGLSKFISCSNRDGQTESVGTFHYMAPEIGKGVYGREIDVYALGIILFEMLTGRVPFEGESSQEIIMKHLTADPDINGIREPYNEVIRRALAKDPEHRFRDVPELLAALNRTEFKSAANEGPALEIPPVQPMFINESPLPDSGILFGEVKELSGESTWGSSRGQKPKMESAQIQSESVREPDEPIARAINSGWNEVADWWRNANLSTPVKTVIIAVVLGIFVVNSAWLIPAGVSLGFLYLAYYVVRSLTTKKKSRQSNRISKAQRMAVWRQGLQNRPLADRLTEGIGSLVVSAIICLILGLFVLIIIPDQVTVWGRDMPMNPNPSLSSATLTNGGDSARFWSFYAWNVIVATLASWALLAMGKCWENQQGDPLTRRFVTLCGGVVIGLLAFAISTFLQLDWRGPYEPIVDFGMGRSPFEPSLLLENGSPKLLSMMFFFGGLFASRRWWKQTDPLRRTRLSIWSVGLCLVWALLLGQFFRFPLPWSVFVAAMITVATQIAAPWLSPEQREHIQKRQLEGR